VGRRGHEVFVYFVGTSNIGACCTHEAFINFMPSPAHSKPQRQAHSKPQRQDHARLKQDPDARAKEISERGIE
jgi:hypothetical protein